MQYRNENTIKSDKRQIKGIKSIKICYVINNVYLIRPLAYGPIVRSVKILVIN